MPQRPPKKWFYEAVRAISHNPEIDDPEAVAAWNWYHGLKPETKKQILESEGDIMAGLPAKYAKYGFKKGWKMFRSSRGSRSTGEYSKKRGSKKGRRRSSMYLRGVDFSAPALLQRPVRRLSSITPNKIIQPVIDLLLIVGGMATAATVKKVLPVKNPHLVNGSGVVAGVGGSLMTKNRFIKIPMLGFALQNTIAEAKILMPKMIPLAGDDEMVYLPVGDDEDIPQLEMTGDEDRFAADDDRVAAEDDRFGYDETDDIEGEDLQ